MKNAALEVRLSRSAHVYREQAADVDGRVLAMFQNRDRIIAMSQAHWKPAAHPPVPRDRALVVVNGPSHDSFLPDSEYDQDFADGYELKYGRA